MSVSRPFAYNPIPPNSLISGTTQVGNLSIGVDPTLGYTSNAGGVQWWMGPDEELGYVIAQSVPSLNQPNPLNIPAGVGFYRSQLLTESSFISTSNYITGQSFASGDAASTYLTSNGFWNSWVPSFVTPTPTPTPTATPTPTIDPDAQSFITAAAITATTEVDAINTLVVGLKSDGLWTKMIALYPFVGGNASSNSYNLKNPAQYQLTFFGGWIHSSNGSIANGINGYAATGLIPNGLMNINSNHLSYYCRNNTFSNYDIGAADNANMLVNQLALINKYTNGNAYYSVDDGYGCVYSTSDSRGLNFGTINTAGITEIYKNATLRMNSTTSVNFLPSVELYINAANANGSAALFSDHQCALASIGTGFSSTEESSFYTLVQNYQTSLSRQV